jgi:hypothetical protein
MSSARIQYIFTPKLSTIPFSSFFVGLQCLFQELASSHNCPIEPEKDYSLRVRSILAFAKSRRGMGRAAAVCSETAL